MYKRLTRSLISVEHASPAYLGLGIIKIIILPSINVCRAPVDAWNSHTAPSWGQELLNHHLSSINVCRAPVYAWNVHPSTT